LGATTLSPFTGGLQIELGGENSVGKTPYDLMRATFPAGTVSGAPKIRAMQIIAELEATTRGPYGGCVGYFSFNGNLDTCIFPTSLTRPAATLSRSRRRGTMCKPAAAG
jgi:hypothetical protein